VGPDGLDDGSRVIPGSQHIDALAKELVSSDPFVCPAQEEKGWGQQSESKGIDEGPNGYFWIEGEEGRDEEAIQPEHKQDTKVYLQAGSEDSGFVQVEVVGEEEGKEGDESDLEQALLVVQGNVGVGAEHDPSGGQEAGVDDTCFAEEQDDSARWIVDI